MSGAKGGMVSGILNIDKPKGLTSHDVVDRVRRLAKQRRVGHAGTLDPLATGVLILCLGGATRIVEYLSESPKAYRATIRFGLVTDTWDLEGKVIEEREWQGLSLAEIQQVLSQFQGTIEQVPPMYSALKHQGKPLYKLARQGITVARKPRRVEIYRLSILDWRPPELVLEVECSKGTYIRSLAYELGQA
ncbi:MAG: tRNA pseudouridine(55) synthase TruB, partial [Anaerolineae bacterium]|nr:tRNA pseudouridine(55) synthase TruB [Anaerolineae bacterium]